MTVDYVLRHVIALGIVLQSICLTKSHIQEAATINGHYIDIRHILKVVTSKSE